jgi:TonB family protein
MRLGLWLLGALTLAAAPREAKETYELLGKGEKLSASGADSLEGRLKKKPQDTDARLQLLAYYATDPAAANRTLRSRHILWVLKNDPHERLGLARVRANALRINCAGDPLADPAAFTEALPHWLAIAARATAQDPLPMKDAVEAIRYCAPEKAEELLIAAGDRSTLGSLYAQLALGITGENYRRSEPTGSDPAIRERPIAQRALAALAEASDRDFLAGATALCTEGAILWADNKLDWDYSTLARRILPLAQKLNPDQLRLLTLTPELPPRGQRPPLTLRVGGNVQQAKLLRQPKPRYPREALSRGIEGTVRLETLLDPDGAVLGLRLVSGPPELVDAARDSVRQWAYSPTLLNGKPVFILTLIDVRFVISDRSGLI